MLALIYAAVILIATTLGSFVGLGGGVIIKPVLDFIGQEPRAQVDFLSCAAVLTMSVVSTGKAIKRKQKFDPAVITLIACGSIAGGWLGGVAIKALEEKLVTFPVRSIQAGVLAVLLAFVCIYVSRCKFSYHIKNKAAILISGLILGFTASFLGIGGGPVNVAVFALMFSMEARESAVYSVAIVFFSQTAKMITMLLSNGVSAYSAQGKTLLFILPAAVLGGIIGSKFNVKFSNKTIRNVFSVCTALLVVLNIYNAVKYAV